MKLGTQYITEHNPKRFAATFALVLILSLSFVATLNYVVNPMAQYSTTCFKPMAQTSRSEKIKLFEHLEQRPEGMILGSSRVMKLDPEYLHQLTGKRFFNAGVNYGKSEDHLAWLGLYEQRHQCFPEVVIVGIDPSSFSENMPTDARLINNRELAGHVAQAISWKDRMKLWEDLFSWDQTKQSVKSLTMQTSGRQLPEPAEHFRPDGLIVYDERESDISAGTYNLQAGIEFNKSEYLPRFLQYGEHSRSRLMMFRELAKKCRNNGTQLYVYVTPMHPELEEYLVSKTDYRQRRDETASFLDSMSTKLGFEFYDFAKLESFDGDPTAFIDGTHPLESNTRRILEVMFCKTEL